MLVDNYTKDKLADVLRAEEPEKVCIVFWHGLGDVVMFMPLLYRLRELFSSIKIDIGFQKGCGQEELVPDAVLLDNAGGEVEGYDFTFHVHFPMAEHLKGLYTKAEHCCREELGIDLISSYPKISTNGSRLVVCHFQATALPIPCNPSEEVAKKIWEEVKEAGYIPIEGLFRHKWYNQKNEKFGFIDSHVRGVDPSVSKLIGLLSSSYASICVASGNLPLSISIMPSRTLYLRNHYSIESYTKEEIASVDVKDYKEGSVKNWITGLEKTERISML